MDFGRETRGHTARAACGHTSSGGQGVDNAFVSSPNYWKHLFEDTAVQSIAHVGPAGVKLDLTEVEWPQAKSE
jgi:hypothetical protein